MRYATGAAVIGAMMVTVMLYTAVRWRPVSNPYSLLQPDYVLDVASPVHLPAVSTHDSHNCPQPSRRQHVLSTCPTLHNSSYILHPTTPSKGITRYMLVDRKHKTMFCFMPKSGCTSWKTLLVLESDAYHGQPPLLSNPLLIHNPALMAKMRIKSLDDYPEKEINSLLDDSFKFMVTRHPLERLYSAYSNKVVDDRTYLYKFHPKIFKKEETKQPPMSFREFIDFLLGHWKRKDSLKFTSDHHWRPQVKICQPCRVHYDHILKLEHIEQDSQLPLSFYNVSQLPRFNVVSGDAKKQHIDWVSVINNLPEDTFNNLMEFYREDFAIFGYGWDRQIGPVCDVIDIDGGVCC